MRDTVLSGVEALCSRRACRSLASFLFAFIAMVFFFTGPISVAQDSKTAAVLPAPSSGKAIVCIYRVYRFTGSASHDELYVNGTHLAKLLNSEYALMEVPPGTVVISGLPKMYYGSAIALNVTRRLASDLQAPLRQNAATPLKTVLRMGTLLSLNWSGLGPVSGQISLDANSLQRLRPWIVHYTGSDA